MSTESARKAAEECCKYFGDACRPAFVEKFTRIIEKHFPSAACQTVAPPPVEGEFAEVHLAAMERQYPPDSLTWQLIRQLRERTAERNSAKSAQKYLLKKISQIGVASPQGEPK